MNPVTPPALDWREFLVRLVERLSARGGAAWTVDEHQLRLTLSVGVFPSDVMATGPLLKRRQECLAAAAKTKRPTSLDFDVPTEAGVVSSTMLFAAVTQGEAIIGFVEILQHGRLPQPECQAQLQLLEQACRMPIAASEPAEAPNDMPLVVTVAPESKAEPASPIDWPAVLEFLRQVQRGQRLSDVAGAIANESRILLDADRVSVAIPYGNRVKIIAVSGQDRVQRRSNVIQAMSRLTKLILATKEPFLFTGGLDEVPDPLERSLAGFTQLSGSRMLLIVPLLAPREAQVNSASPDDHASSSAERKVAGALIIEQMQHSQPQPRLKAHLDLVRDHVATAMSNSRQYESIFLLPVWATVGRWWSMLKGRRLAWTLAIGIALIGVSTGMFVVPWRYRIDGKGQLMPVVQRDVFAPWDGQVVELLTRGGDRVSADQPLVRLRNDELAEDLVKARGELAENRKLVVALHAQLDEAERTAQKEEETRLRGKVAETQIEIEGIKERLAILTDRINRLTVRAPITGIVTTFQTEQLLQNRPVQRGELMLQVMDDRGDWQLELEVPEQRLGHILAAQAEAGAQLPIDFRLLTRPEATHRAQLSSIGTRSVTSEAQGSVIELRATLDAAEIDRPAIGAQVRARIDCGEKPLGYCLFGDVIEFIQKYLWW